MRKTVKALALGAIATSMVLTAACSANQGTDKPREEAKAATFFVDYEGKTPAPRPEIPGAKTGGTVYVVEHEEHEHLDPQQIYVSNALNTSMLIHRRLTGYIEASKPGEQMQLVGDLATNAGVTKDGGKTWEYELRDGIKFEDGTPITAEDVKYGIARSFGPFGAQGTQFFQDAADPDRKYKGPHDEPNAPVPGVTVEGTKKIKFTFDKPQPSLPFIMAFPLSTPVQKAKDTKEKYDREWVSTGPYKRAEYVAGTKLVLEKNPSWDPKTDPIRKQYLDKISFDFTADAKAQTDRLVAAQGNDANAVMVDNVPATQIPAVKANADAMKRVHTGPNQYAYYIAINNSRITDLAIRQALNYATNRDAYIKAVGGADVADPATSITAVTNPGHKKFDVYPSKPGNEGDVDKAKELLKGKTLPKYVFCTANTPSNQTTGNVLIEGWKRAGFDVTLKLIDRAAYYTTVGRKGIDCDLMSAAWGEDYPDPETVLGTILDGKKIKDEGNNNYAYFTNAAIEAELQKLREMTDRGAAAALYGDLEEKIMKDHAPVVPLRYGRNFTIAGPNVGGTFLNQYAQFDLTTAYIK